MRWRECSFIVAGVGIAGVIASLVVQHQAEARIREKNEVLERQDQQLSELATQREQLSNTVVEATSSQPDGAIGELARLRVEAARLREQTNQLGWEADHIIPPQADGQ